MKALILFATLAIFLLTFGFFVSVRVDEVEGVTQAVSVNSEAELAVVPVTSTSPLDVLYRTAEHDPKQAIESLKQLVETNPEYADECHEIAHELGHITYEQFGQKTFDSVDPFCGAGYLHGVLEVATVFDEGMKLTDMVHTICSGEIEEACLHGLGHALYKSTQDVGRALVYCNQVFTNNKDCYDGVYMEVFDVEVKASDPPLLVEAKATCNTSPDYAKASCYFYLPRVQKESSALTTKSICEGLPNSVAKLSCAQGSGVMFMKYEEHFDERAAAQDCTLYANIDMKSACLLGVQSYSEYGSVHNTKW